MNTPTTDETPPRPQATPPLAQDPSLGRPGLASIAVPTTGVGATAASPARPTPIFVSGTPAELYDRIPSRLAIELQRFFGNLLVLPVYAVIATMFRFIGGYRIENMRELRKQYRELTRDGRPLMICLNHLTYIDSALMIWALGSNIWYQFNYAKFTWNLPAGDHFKQKFRHRLVAYLAKCLYIHRDGTKRHKNGVLEECMRLLRRGDVVTIFPEGRRSRTGRFELDRLTYGVGKVCSEVKNCRVFCAYIRSDAQDLFSSYPPRGSRFRIATSLIEPRTELAGRDGCADLTMQIAREIKRLENQYFAERLASPRPTAPGPA